MGPWECICCTDVFTTCLWSLFPVSRPYAFHINFTKYEGLKDPKRLASSRTDQQKWHVLQKSKYKTYNVWILVYYKTVKQQIFLPASTVFFGSPRPQRPLVLVVLLCLPTMLCAGCVLFLPSMVWSAASPDLPVDIHTPTSLVSVSICLILKNRFWKTWFCSKRNGLATCNHFKLALDL